MCPRKDNWLLLNSHLFGFKVTSLDRILSNTAVIHWLCYCCVLPYTRTSSIWHNTPSRPASVLFIRLRECSGALEIPKGNLLKQYRPFGMMNVVRCREGLASGICQNPLLVSNLVKTLAPASCDRISSTVGNGWTSSSTLSFRGFKSTHIWMFFDFLGTNTIPAHHSVGSSTLEITPNDSILSGSFVTSSVKSVKVSSLRLLCLFHVCYGLRAETNYAKVTFLST